MRVESIKYDQCAYRTKRLVDLILLEFFDMYRYQDQDVSTLKYNINILNMKEFFKAIEIQ
jgi:hypothetical protein